MRDLASLELEIERVLAVGAHPDDCEFGAGGALAGFAERGIAVTIVVCTDGSRGGRGVDDVARVRRQEQQRASSLLGVQETVQLDHRDGELSCDDVLRAELTKEIRRTRPDVVIAHDARTLWRTFGRRSFLGHTDHRAAGQATLDALYPRAGSPNFFPEQLEQGLEPWLPEQLWLFDSTEPDLSLDIGATLERKLDALAAHASQQGSAGGLVEAARGVARRNGRDTGAGEAVETFLALKLR